MDSFFDSWGLAIVGLVSDWSVYLKTSAWTNVFCSITVVCVRVFLLVDRLSDTFCVRVCMERVKRQMDGWRIRGDDGAVMIDG